MVQFASRMDLLKGSEIRELLKLTAQPDIISFAGGMPAPELFPVEQMMEASRAVLEENGRVALQYSSTEGYPKLRQQIADRMLAKNNIHTDADHILVTSGSQQGLDFSARVFLDPGDVVLLESPSYLGAVNAFKACQPRFIEVPTDDGGMIMEELEKILATTERVKMIYVIPDFQNPTGRTWSLERRKQILEIARRYELPILEDNPYGELRYEGETVPTLKSMDATGIVTYMGSFSKVLSPGIRLGWLLAERGLIEKYESAKECADLQASTLTQMVVDTYLEHNDLDANIRRLNDLYRGRRDRMLALLASEFPEGSRWTHPCGGLFLWVTMPEGIDTDALLPTMAAHKAAYIPGRTFFADGNERRCLRLNYSNASEEDMTRGMTIMGQVFRDALAKG